MKIEIKAPDKECVLTLLGSEGLSVVFLAVLIVSLLAGTIIMVEKSFIIGLVIMIVPITVVVTISYWLCKLVKWAEED